MISKVTHRNNTNITISLPNGKAIDIVDISLSIVLCVASIAYMVGITNNYVVLAIVRGVEYLSYVLFILNTFKRKQFGKALFLTFGILLLIIATWAIYPYNRPALEEVAPYMLLQPFYFYIAYEYVSNDKAYNITRFLSYVVVFTGIIVLLFATTRELPNRIAVSNGMFFSMFFLLGRKRKRHPVDTVFGLIALALMLIFGRRAHLLCLAIVVVYTLLIDISKEKSQKKIIKAVALSLIAITITLSYRYILLAISGAFTSLGVESRTIQLLVNNEFLWLNGRDTMYENAWNMLLAKPWTGNGIGSTMMRNFETAWQPENYIGVNTHNSLLEIAAEFGFPGLVLYVVSHAIIFIRIARMDMTTDERTLMMYLVAAGPVTSLMSTSYLNNAFYALFLGLYFNLRRKQKLRIHALEAPPKRG